MIELTVAQIAEIVGGAWPISPRKGAGWSGMAEATSLDTMTQMNQAFRNIVNMLHGVRDGLVRDANNYEQQEQASQQILSS